MRLDSETREKLENAGLKVWTTEGSTRPGTVCSSVRTFCQTGDGYIFRLDLEFASFPSPNY